MKLRKILLQNIPNNIIIDDAVPVDKDISKGYYAAII